MGGSIGAGALQRLGAELEHTLKENPAADIQSLLVETGTELDRIVNAINQALGGADTQPKGGSPVLPENYRERLQQLADQIAQYDGEATDTLDELIADVNDPQASPALEKLKELVSQYDYDGALAVITEIIAEITA